MYLHTFLCTIWLTALADILIMTVELECFCHNNVLYIYLGRFQVGSCCSNLTGAVRKADILCKFIEDTRVVRSKLSLCFVTD